MAIVDTVCRQFKENVYMNNSNIPKHKKTNVNTIYQPNAETIAAMMEAERIASDTSVKGYTDMDEMFAELTE